MIGRYIYILLCIMLWSPNVMAQTDRQLVREGNKMFHRQDYGKAEVEYRKALAKNSRNTQAMYNLGCALMMQKRDSLGIIWLEKAAREETIPMRRSKAFHNMGWICQSHGMYAEAIEAYKSALRLNPSDNETRYNLALCKHLQKKNPGGGNNNEDKKDKDKNNKDDKRDQNTSRDEKDKDKDQNRKQRPKEELMSKENAEQLLNAAMQEEKATQQRLKKSMQQPMRQKLEKNW